MQNSKGQWEKNGSFRATELEQWILLYAELLLDHLPNWPVVAAGSFVCSVLSEHCRSSDGLRSELMLIWVLLASGRQPLVPRPPTIVSRSHPVCPHCFFDVFVIPQFPAPTSPCTGLARGSYRFVDEYIREVECVRVI